MCFFINQLNQWFSKCVPRIPGDPWIRFYNGYFEVYLFFNWTNNVLLKIIAELVSLTYVYFVWSLEYQIKKLPVSTKRVTISFIKVKSFDALLCKLLVCIIICRTPGLTHTFLIMGTCYPDTLYGCESVVIFRSQKGPRAEKFGRHFIDQ